jgi:hypothetical protein
MCLEGDGQLFSSLHCSSARKARQLVLPCFISSRPLSVEMWPKSVDLTRHVWTGTGPSLVLAARGRGHSDHLMHARRVQLGQAGSGWSTIMQPCPRANSSGRSTIMQTVTLRRIDDYNSWLDPAQSNCSGALCQGFKNQCYCSKPE